MADTTNGVCPACCELLEWIERQESLYAEKAVRTHHVDKAESNRANLISRVLARVLNRRLELDDLMNPPMKEQKWTMPWHRFLAKKSAKCDETKSLAKKK